MDKCRKLIGEHNKMQEQNGRRYIIKRAAGNYYVTIMPYSIMVHRPNESDPANAKEYACLNAICRLASKLVYRGYAWGQVAYQLKSSGVGHRTIVDELADVIREEIQTRAEEQNLDIEFEEEGPDCVEPRLIN